MWSRTTLLIICIAVVAVAFGVAFLVKSKEVAEPEYNGRSISEWYEQWFIAYDAGDRMKVDETLLAVSEIGTNALPYLLNSIAYTPSKPGKVSAFFHGMPIVGEWLSRPQKKRAQRAWRAEAIFALLGPKAAPAIPELVRLINTTTDEGVRDRASFCLCHTTSDDAIPIIAMILNKPEDPACKRILAWFAHRRTRFLTPFKFSTNLAQIVPTFVHCSTNRHVELQALSALGNIGLAPELTIPTLTNALQSPKSYIRATAAKALQYYGPAASNSIPALKTALNDTDHIVREAATNALRTVSGITD